MKAFGRSFNWPAAALLLAVVVIAGAQWQADGVAAPSAAAIEPAVVVTINIETVFQGLAERGAADAQLQELADRLDAGADERREAIQLLSDDLENVLPPGSEAYKNAQRDLTRQTYELNAYIEYALARLEREKADVLRGIYARIKQSAQALAQANGYDIVFVDDSVSGLPDAATEREMSRQISARRMLYVNTRLDVTQELIGRMNAQYEAQ
jgi:Skp family chaperone for outer membrane proteins